MGRPIAYSKLERSLALITANLDPRIEDPIHCSATEIRVSRGDNFSHFYDYIIVTPSSGIFSCSLSLDHADIVDGVLVGPTSSTINVTYVAPTSAFPVI